MTVSGLKLLQKEEEASRGFFLLIEGARIDHVSIWENPSRSFQTNPQKQN